MKKTVLIFGLLFFCIMNSSSQKDDIIMRLNSISSVKGKIRINFEFVNVSQKDIAVYIPTSTDICRGFFKIKFISTNDSTIHTYEPCTWYADAKLIEMDCENSVILKPKEKKVLFMNLIRKEMLPLLRKNTSYKVLLELYLKEMVGKSVFRYYLEEDISSNYLIYNN